MPAQDPLNPGRSLRFDARAAFRRLRRVAVVAPGLAVLLVLAAAGAVLAADGLDVVDAATTAPDRITTELQPAKDRVVQTAVETVRSEPAQAALTIVRGSRDRVDSVVDPVVKPVVPVPLPTVALPDPYEGPERGIEPRRPQSRAAETVAWTDSSSSSIAVTPDQPTVPAAQIAATVDHSVFVRPMQPVLPLDSSGATGDVAIGGSGFGVGPWLGQAPPLLPGFAWRSVLRPPVALSIPRGLTPEDAVPPG